MAKTTDNTPSAAGQAVAADFNLLFDTVMAKVAADAQSDEQNWALHETYMNLAVEMYQAYVSTPE